MINIQDIIPFMKPGWVAMDETGEWWWYSKKPYIGGYQWHVKGGNVGSIDRDTFDIAHAEDWTQSLQKVDAE